MKLLLTILLLAVPIVAQESITCRIAEHRRFTRTQSTDNTNSLVVVECPTSKGLMAFAVATDWPSPLFSLASAEPMAKYPYWMVKGWPGEWGGEFKAGRKLDAQIVEGKMFVPLHRKATLHTVGSNVSQRR